MSMDSLRVSSPIYSDGHPDVEYNQNTLRILKEKLEPTEEDMQRQLTDDELKELCLRYKCRVDAYRWNPVYDYKVYLQRKGKFDGRSTRTQERLLLKAVNRHKQRIMYDENEIKTTRKIEWRIQKKDSILSLDLWAYQRKEKEGQAIVFDVTNQCGVTERQQEILVSKNIDNIAINDVHQTDVLNSEEEQQVSESLGNIAQLPVQVIGSHPQLSESIDDNVALENISNKGIHQQSIPATSANTIATQECVIASELFPSQVDTDESELLDADEDDECYDYINRELNSIDADQIHAVYSSELHNEMGDRNEKCALFDVNTESMTVIDSEESAAPVTSQEQQSQAQSQEVFHKEYEDFDIDVPLTSTQSQRE